MLIHPQFDPAANRIGSFAIHWYGLMYAVGFIGAWLLAIYRAKKPNSGWTIDEVSDLLFYTALGVILGGRVGYMLFYDLPNFLSHPWIVFQVWQGGMSFHGGLLGVLFAFYLFSRKTGKHFFDITDFASPLVPIGLATGRIGNFINGELWGRITDVPWAMVFPLVDSVPRHPSQIYQLLGEGVLLGIAIWIYAGKPRRVGQISGFFLLGYGICRFLAEYAREPDSFLGLLGLGLSMGQWLCMPMILFGICLMTAFKSKSK